MTTKTTRRRPSAPIEELADEISMHQEVDDLNVSKLDIFAMLACSAVAKKMDDPVRIAHESYQIALKMNELSEYYSMK
jgi:hypothetical protein